MNLNPLALFGRREDRALETSSPLYQAWLANFGTTSSSGITITTDTAIASVAVLACLIVRAETAASLPVGVFRKSGRDRLAEPDHPADRLISKQPNDLQTAPEFWRWKQEREDLTGNAYVRIERRSGQPNKLWPLFGDKPTMRVYNGRVVYEYRGDATTVANEYASADVLHFKGAMLANPYEGKSLVELTAENLGLSVGFEKFLARFLGNGNHFPLYLQTDQDLRKDDIEKLRSQMSATSGILPAGETRIFDRGLKVMQNSMSLKDADLTAQQRWTLEQVCRTWRVPPQMVQDLTHGTYTNSEQADLWFAKHTITPIVKNNEAVLDAGLFLEGDDAYVKFNVNGLLRGDFVTRMTGYSAAITAGFMTRDEARELEDWNQIEGLEKPLVPLNMGILGPDGKIEESEPEPVEIAEPADDETDPDMDSDEDVDGGDDPDSEEDATDEGDGNPVPENFRALMAPVLVDAIECIRTRAEQDRDRGRDTADTIGFAERKLAPIAQAFAVAGVDFDLEAEVKEALA